MAKKDYNQRQAEKAARYGELAEKNKQKSDSRYNAAKDISDHIPFGQPILVGHHSEARHRRDLEKIDNNMRKSIEHDAKAKHYNEKAERATNPYAISQDDPEALTRLKEKLKDREDLQEKMKTANSIIRKKLSDAEKVEHLIKLGISEKSAIKLLDKDQFGGAGFARFQLTNNNANIKRIKQRIHQLEKLEAQEDEERTLHGVKMAVNTDENRFQLFFDGKPEEEVRKDLKSNGFRWSPRNGCWQSYIGDRYKYRAEKIITKHYAASSQ